ncbi:alpha/beta hydrolase [Acidovorax kalamii]|uniref:alpha/beta hydrolase n=1 Tax=Acidovorax kalamii TaxID=2004485 RepID=UPI00209138BD|nr:alpha/beta hydrolase [Acidovorax kalamii]MCO5355864.1 alpha/beta hydrolase [Acidovorax kalamii]
MRKIVRWALRLVVVFCAVAITFVIAFNLSPRPGVWLVNVAFDYFTAQTNKALLQHVPHDVHTVSGIPYTQRWPSLKMDVHRPSVVGGKTWPTVVWVHGGAWVSGRKEDIASYLKVLAAQGFTVVGVDYTLAPDAQHPAQVQQVNDALAFLQSTEARKLGIDSSQIFLAGDSAGAQIAGQLANSIAVPDYAQSLGFKPSVASAQLKGAVLFCGPFDMEMVRLDGAFGAFLRVVLWSFVGQKNFSGHPALHQASVLRHVTNRFPPTFISAGNGDPLLPHSKALSEKLQGLTVPVDALFFDVDLRPPLGHEYQFDLNRPEGRLALDRLTAFLKRHSH